MIRVCYVIPTLSVGGTERQLLHLIRGLVHEHEITVVCTSHDGALAGDVRRLGAMVHVLDLWGGWDPRGFSKLRQLFRRHRPDILHTFLFGFDLAANRAARETGVPVVISSRREIADWRKKRHLRVQGKANSLVDMVVTNSQAVADYTAKTEGLESERLRVIPNGCEADAFVSQSDPDQLRIRFRIPPKARLVGMVANFSPVKDHRLFLATAKELIKRRGKDIHFLLVGSGPLRKDIERLIHSARLEHHFTRVASLDEIRDLYRIMEVSVLCSRLEGFPNVLLEAMAARVPVVASAVGGIPELLDNGTMGHLVTQHEPGAFADVIERVLDQPEETKELCERAAAYVRERYTVSAMVEAHRELYHKLLAASSRARY